MLMTVYLFWVSLSILFYCYVGYGMLAGVVSLIRSFSRKKMNMSYDEWPTVTMIITSYNEADVIEKKIHNTLAIDYPAGLLKIIFVTDGSTDGSDGIIRNHPGIILMHQPERQGKFAAINRAMNIVDSEFVLFSDTNAMLTPASLRKMIPHFRDDLVGGVAGEKKISGRNVSAVGEAEGLYWQYESFVKKLDARFFTVVGAAGELFAIRTALFSCPARPMILDDFIISMEICLRGYRIAYEPGAFATEPASASLLEEEKRKVRISAGAYQAIGYLKGCLNLLRHPMLAFQYISRRLLRWVICPLMLILLFITSAILAFDQDNSIFYKGFFLGQIVFYLLSILGWFIVRSGKRAGMLTVPFYFVFMNYCLVKGFFRFISGKQTVLWERSLREVVE